MPACLTNTVSSELVDVSVGQSCSELQTFPISQHSVTVSRRIYCAVVLPKMADNDDDDDDVS